MTKFLNIALAALAALVTLQVYAAGPATATASVPVSWAPPTTWSDGTPITGLTGFNVYWGLSPGAYQKAVAVPGATVKSAQIPVTITVPSVPAVVQVYFAITAISTAGTPTAPETWESGYSNEVVRQVTFIATQMLPSAPGGIVVAMPLKWPCKLNAPAGTASLGGAGCAATSP